MSDTQKLPRLRDGQGPRTPLEAQAGRLLDAAGPVEPWDTEDRQESWRLVAARAAESRSTGRGLALGLSLAGAAVLVFGVVLARRQAPARTQPPAQIAAASAKGEAPHQIDLGSSGTIEVSDGTVYQLLPVSGRPAGNGGLSVRLDAGRLCATIRHDPSREGPFTVLTPKLRVVDVGTRFCVEATAGRTKVDVSEGEVRVEGEGGWTSQVVAGQSLASDEPRFMAPVPTVAAPAPVARSSCEALPGLQAREACWAEASAGNGLAAQNALYNLALLARDQRHDGASALSLFQAYRHRFPKGPLVPEADLGILTELSAEARYGEAASEATQYLDAYPGEVKAAQVGLMLGNLERERLGSPAAARSAYEQVLRSTVEPEIAGEALFGLALSELQLGQKTEAQATARRYLAEHPAGARAAEAAWLLQR
jgi:TolA-binding protein